MDELNLDQHEDVTSSNLKSAGTKGTYLVVEFKNGQIYVYKDCAHLFSDLVSAESVGEFFNANVKHQPFERLSGNEWPEEW